MLVHSPIRTQKRLVHRLEKSPAHHTCRERAFQTDRPHRGQPSSRSAHRRVRPSPLLRLARWAFLTCVGFFGLLAPSPSRAQDDVGLPPGAADTQAVLSRIQEERDMIKISKSFEVAQLGTIAALLVAFIAMTLRVGTKQNRIRDLEKENDELRDEIEELRP